MATTKVSDLSALTTTDGAEELYINDGGTSKKVTIDNVLHDNSIRSEHYVDGSIDNAHIADDAIDSEHYADGSIDTAHIANDAVTADKLANAINTAIAANTAKTTNATHTGDVTGSGALTIAVDAVDIAMLSATGTASSSTFLRGDNSWVTPTDTNTTYTVGDGGLTQINFTSADNTKLDGIEASADVTDSTNVTAAGALMDSELAGIAAVKATTGTFLSADETKLDGIEASATADQTAGEILTLLEDGIDSVHYKDGSIDNEHLADNAVGLAEMAGGTDGNIISYDASGDPVAMATGNDGQVLTSAGAGSPPAFEDAAAAGLDSTAVSVAKSWIIFNGTGTASITDSFGIGSITDYGTGNYKQTFSTALANATHVTVTGHHHSQGSNGQYDTHIDIGTRATNSTRFTTSQAGSNYDTEHNFLATFGDS